MSLFGNLFDETGDDSDDEDNPSNESQQRIESPMAATCVRDCTPKPDEKPGLTEPPKPPAARPEHGLCGILNRGATCYLNSLLQVSLFRISVKIVVKLFKNNYITKLDVKTIH